MARQSAASILADLFEHADVTLNFWSRETNGVVERDLTDKERRLIIKALRRPQR